jgi:transposase
MELVTILNHCHPFRGFVYQRTRLVRHHNTLEIVVRPRQGSAAICSGCHQRAPGYNRRAAL